MQISPVGVGHVPAPKTAPAKANDANADVDASRASNQAAAAEAVGRSENEAAAAVIAANVRAAASVAHVLGRDVQQAVRGAVFDARA